MADTIKIKQVRSTNGCKQDQVRTVRALGLHKIGRASCRERV